MLLNVLRERERERERERDAVIMTYSNRYHKSIFVHDLSGNKYCILK